MRESTWVEPPSPQGIGDVLTEILREGARQLPRQAVEAELEAHLQVHARRRLETVSMGIENATLSGWRLRVGSSARFV